MKMAHTTKTKKAKCLKYRNRKRCGRKAVHEVTFIDTMVRVSAMHMPVCDECLEELQTNDRYRNVVVRQSNKKGFTVSTNQFGPTERTYKAI